MFEDVPVSARSRCRRVRRSKRLTWVAAVFAVAAFSFGPGAVFALDDNAPAVTATPEDPCLLNQTCDEQQRIADDLAAKNELQARCDAFRQLGIFAEECVPLEPTP